MREDAIFKPAIKIGEKVATKIPTIIYTTRGRSIRIGYIKEVEQFEIRYRSILINPCTNLPQLNETYFMLSKEAALATSFMFGQFFFMFDIRSNVNFVNHVNVFDVFANVLYRNESTLCLEKLAKFKIK